MIEDRWFVPDLSPEQRPQLQALRPRFIFVAESPHLNEIAPEERLERRPLCGAAGKVWWGMLTAVLEGKESRDVALPHLLDFCLRHRIAVMNAVQLPLDPKIALKYPAADPLRTLGFAKTTGENSYKRKKGSAEVGEALASLAARLHHPSAASAPVVCLGNDAEWFVSTALGKESAGRVVAKLPHPSCWWRNRGVHERAAREKLDELFAGTRDA